MRSIFHLPSKWFFTFFWRFGHFFFVVVGFPNFHETLVRFLPLHLLRPAFAGVKWLRAAQTPRRQPRLFPSYLTRSALIPLLPNEPLDHPANFAARSIQAGTGKEWRVQKERRKKKPTLTSNVSPFKRYLKLLINDGQQGETSSVDPCGPCNWAIWWTAGRYKKMSWFLLGECGDLFLVEASGVLWMLCLYFSNPRLFEWFAAACCLASPQRSIDDFFQHFFVTLSFFLFQHQALKALENIHASGRLVPRSKECVQPLTRVCQKQKTACSSI